ncbi:MAG: DUF4864 domain-containing protein [Geminicoccaceae bacterium]
MRWKLPALAVAIMLVTGSVLAASPVPRLNSADAAAIHDVIEAQLRAFRSDDGAQAFAYASPAIQSIFKNPDAFMSMVRAGYQPAYRPQEVEFRDLVPVEGRWTQRVLLVGPDGVPIVAQYVMEKQPDGSWRIDGCLLERSTEQTT